MLTVKPDNGNVRFYATARQLIVDWGDGSSPETYTDVTEIAYTYADDNTYTVRILQIGLTTFGDEVSFSESDDGKVNYSYKVDYTPLTGFIQQLHIDACASLKIVSVERK
jgi:hypothetical protein